ncbi:hypothetical protein MC885_010613 [Smutsia gigantea]|nr:hypothetical protein MC885_010613 [Smutsia gigantea]
MCSRDGSRLGCRELEGRAAFPCWQPGMFTPYPWVTADGYAPEGLGGRVKEVSRGYKVSLGFPECKDLRGRRDRRDKRVTRENQDCQEQKGHEVFLARMVPQVPPGSQDAMGQRVIKGSAGPQECRDKPRLKKKENLPPKERRYEWTLSSECWLSNLDKFQGIRRTRGKIQAFQVHSALARKTD